MEITINLKCTGGELKSASEFISKIKELDCKVIINVDSVPSIGKIDNQL